MEEKRQFGRFWSLMRRLPEADKETLVYQWSKGRTVHLHEMTDDEYRQMCDAMDGVARLDEKEALRREYLRKRRSEVLHLMQKLGVDTGNWERVDAFCKQGRIAGKAFARLRADELMGLSRKLRAILRKKEKKQEAEAEAAGGVILGILGGLGGLGAGEVN